MDWGYDCITDTLERRNAIVDLENPVTAKWLSIAGSQLFDGVSNGTEVWAFRSQRDLGREKPVMTMERWMVWEHQMEVLEKGVQEVAGETRLAYQLFKGIREASGQLRVLRGIRETVEGRTRHG